MSKIKQILCYGDSNTYGTIGRWFESDEPSERFDENTRWTCILQKELGENYHVIEEGLGGRTTIYSPENEPWKNGETYLTPCLLSHRPLDLVILMLGTNDLHVKKDLTKDTLDIGIRRLVDLVQSLLKAGEKNQPPKILLIAPPDVRPSAENGRTAVYPKFRAEIGRELSLAFPALYEKVAKEKGCFFMNSQLYTCPCPADGVHFDSESHIRFGKAVADFIKENL